MHSGAAAQADLEDTAGDDAWICDQIEEPAADVLRSKPRLRNRVCLHHPTDQVVGNVVAALRLHHRRLHRRRADDVDCDALLGDLQGHGLGEPMTPHLVALYAASSGTPMRPPIEDVTTIRPKRCFRITGIAARTHVIRCTVPNPFTKLDEFSNTTAMLLKHCTRKKSTPTYDCNTVTNSTFSYA